MVRPDPLSNVLRAVRLTGAVFFDIEARPPWAVAGASGPDIAPTVLPGVQRLISYHVITEGTGWARLHQGPAVRLETGDVIVFPHGDAHVLSSHPGVGASPGLSVYTSALRNRPLPVRLGGDGAEATHIVCGFLGCDVRPFNPLVSGLPRLLHVSSAADAQGAWLSQFARFALAEARNWRPGSESVLARVSELMFVEALRRHLDALPDERTGWLAGLRDEFVGRALALLHERLDHPWTLEELARESGLSRSALAERFAHLVGERPEPDPSPSIVSSRRRRPLRRRRDGPEGVVDHPRAQLVPLSQAGSDGRLEVDAGEDPGGGVLAGGLGEAPEVADQARVRGSARRRERDEVAVEESGQDGGSGGPDHRVGKRDSRARGEYRGS